TPVASSRGRTCPQPTALGLSDLSPESLSLVSKYRSEIPALRVLVQVPRANTSCSLRFLAPRERAHPSKCYRGLLMGHVLAPLSSSCASVPSLTGKALPVKRKTFT